MSDETHINGQRIPDDYLLGPDSYLQPGVPAGALEKRAWASKIYPGTVRDYWVYVPAAYDPSTPACVMIFQDGWTYADPEGGIRVTAVFANLMHRKEMPVTIGVFVNHGQESKSYLDDTREGWRKYSDSSQRSLEYDTLSDRYATFLLNEILPEVGRRHNLRQEPESRAICGSSSGGICAWTAAGERPDSFGKVLSHVGSFADIRGGHAYPFMIRKTERKPIRVLLQAGSNDLDCEWGNWALCNQQMEAALRFKGYDFKFIIGDGGHTVKHGACILPESLRWLWRDWSSPR